MRISLITPSFNQAKYIGRTIDSVLSQDGSFDLEYRVLDGASTDETVSILESYGERLRWTSHSDEGQIDAINHGLATATGDIVGWINSDDLLLEGALDAVTRTFEQNPECSWVFGDCIIIDENDSEIRKLVSAYKRFHAKRYSRNRLLTRNFISQMTVFWKRELLDEIGFLDPNFSLAFDYDFWLRLSVHHEPIYIDHKLAAFRWYSTSKSGANVTAQMAEDQRLAEKHGGRGRYQRFAKQLNHRVRSLVYRVYDSFALFCNRFAGDNKTE